MTKSKLDNALKEYYSSFDYGTGIMAYKKGGQMGLKKFTGGGDKDEDTTIDNGATINPAVAWGGFNSNSGSTKWGGLASTAVNLIGDTVNGYNNIVDKTKQLSSQTRQYGTGAFDNVWDNDALIMALSSTPSLASIDKKDIRNKTVGQDIGSALSTGINAGLSTGNLWVGLGATALDGVKSIWQRAQASTYADQINNSIKRKNEKLKKVAYNATQRVDDYNDWMRMMAYYNNPYEYALGGEMRTHGSDFNNGFTFINEGGTHETNPYEGVLSGVDEEGNPNLVEQGEVIWNNEYVFSDRLKIPETLAKKYKLGGDLTFADAITKVTAESRERPNDPVSNETNRAIVNEFMDEQEALRESEQIAAAEKVQQAYDEDFMNQLSAYAPQGQPMVQGAPMEMGMPQQQPLEGEPIEGEPVMSAFGGHKFEGGGYRVAKFGNRYYVVPEGTPKLTGVQRGGKYIIDDAFKDFASFASIAEANREVEKLRREALPALEYQSDIQASGISVDTGDKILRKQTGYDAHGRPTYQYTVIDPNNGKKYFYSSYEAAAKKYTSIPRTVDDPRVKGGIAYVSPYGDIHLNGKKAQKALQERLHPQSTKTPASTTKSTVGGIGTPAAAATLPARATQTDTTAQALPEIVEEVNTPAKTNYVATTSTGAQQKQGAAATSTGSNSGNTSRMRTPSGATIGYNRKINGKEFEAADDYQAFLNYMRSNPKSKDAEKWYNYIQDSIRESGSKYQLRGFDDWSYLAEDGKVGPVHQATKRAAQEFAKRQRNSDLLTPILPNEKSVPIPNTRADIDANLQELSRLLPTPDNGGIKPRTPYTGKSEGTGKKGGNTGGIGKESWERKIPLYVDTAMALNSILQSPDYTNADAIIEAARQVGVPVNIPVQTIGDYRKRNPFDERYLVNMANQNRLAASRGVTNTAGGNRAMDLLGNMSVAYNNQLDLGEIMRQAYLANRQDDAQVAEFNRGTNIQNMNAINQRNLSQAQLNSQRQQAMLHGLTSGYGLRQSIWQDWRNDRDANIEAAADAWGSYGREKESDLMAYSLARELGIPYSWDPKNGYTFNAPAAKGGYKKSKKRRF